jgi:hypothetical protein
MHHRTVQHLQVWVTTAALFLVHQVQSVTRPQIDDDDRDRGDVPGWVMITVMTAIVVVAIIAVFKPQVTAAVKNAFDSVSNSGK